MKPRPKRLLRTAVLLICVSLAPDPLAYSQGCAQCRDNTAATPPATQRAYRRAITLLALTGATLFTGTVLLLKKLS